MWLKWLPWRFALSYVARRKGFIDPVMLMSRLQGFAQPSEVAAPLELIRAGAVFHARGFINTRAIQHNLDWVWPYWVEQQFDPHSPSFIPRAFSITHINLSHRNWTAVGQPGFVGMPVVDPRGLVTPHFDGWSLDFWVVPDTLVVADALLPSRAGDAEAAQRLEFEDGLSVRTEAQGHGASLSTRALVVREEANGGGGADDAGYACRIDASGRSDAGGWLVVSLRPANPEGVSFIHSVAWDAAARRWLVNGGEHVALGEAPARVGMSCYRNGDVLSRLDTCADASKDAELDCGVGLATAAAMYRLDPGRTRELSIRVPLKEEDREQGTLVKRRDPAKRPLVKTWDEALAGTCAMEVPEARWQFLYDAAVRTLVLLSPDDVYPGPYTYKRFWFRDAALMLHAMLAVGLDDVSEHVIRRFPLRQRPNGYFLSQEGEWDSNGEVLWVLRRFVELTGRPLGEDLLRSAREAARWIQRKRLPKDDAPRPRKIRKGDDGQSPVLHAGLLPAGFSAEHLGPNDYYYWDDFWGVAGLHAAADLMRRAGDAVAFDGYTLAAQDFMACVERSLQTSRSRRGRIGVPASPYRRMDAGAVGSIVVGYPLRLWDARDERLLDTVEFLLEHCTVRGGFFQDMIHSGINAYLTLQLAQVLLRAGDERYLGLIQATADLASPTGQWPEAIHPRTGGGCMGDGQHGWAAAEWALMMRSLFVREEGGALVLASGIPRAWLESGRTLRFGPAPTPHGPVSVEIEPRVGGARVRWNAAWRGKSPRIEVGPPGARVVAADGATEAVVSLGLSELNTETRRKDETRRREMNRQDAQTARVREEQLATDEHG